MTYWSRLDTAWRRADAYEDPHVVCSTLFQLTKDLPSCAESPVLQGGDG